MLQSYPTKNGTGISIFGNFAELNFLYDTIHHFAETLDETKNNIQKAQSNLLMNFAYEVRKASYGNRLTDKFTYSGDNTEHTLYGFQLVWTDVLIFINVLRFNAGFNQSDKLQQAILYNLEYTVEASLFDYDSEGANHIKNYIGHGINITDEFAFIIYQALHIKYVTMKSGKTRFRKIPHLLDGHFSSWKEEYKNIIASFRISAKQQNCEVTDLGFSEFPEIVW
ncbi:MAG: hypothetical protein CUR34_11495 [Sediminibacterium sp.]|nr:MAG: hypothetical protein CUR34_11495 [Sediminibacterium sp.] [Sediminibacterium sp. FEMGT703S]